MAVKTHGLTLDMILLFVQDLQKELDFWSGTLGLPVIARHGPDFVELDAGSGRRLALHGGGRPRNDQESEGRTGFIPSFNCDGPEAMARKLVETGVALVRRQDQPYATILTFADPEGNLFDIHELKRDYEPDV